jgi:hypothetical protein
VYSTNYSKEKFSLIVAELVVFKQIGSDAIGIKAANVR